MSGDALIRGRDEGDTVANPAGGDLTYKVRSEETAGALTAWESTAAPGEGPPVHVHRDEDEFMYVLDGLLRFRLGETDRMAPAGSFVFIPRGLPHTWQNAGDGEARILFGFAPASPGMERFFERAGELPDETRLAEAFGEFAQDAGMDVLGPPLAQSDPPG
jgi:quercetin dioxygenase-like cupin family protein